LFPLLVRCRVVLVSHCPMDLRTVPGRSSRRLSSLQCWWHLCGMENYCRL
jgi:hypothetical protein